MSFNEWYLENKESNELRDGYREYKFECKQIGERILPFREWAKMSFNQMN